MLVGTGVAVMVWWWGMVVRLSSAFRIARGKSAGMMAVMAHVEPNRRESPARRIVRYRSVVRTDLEDSVATGIRTRKGVLGSWSVSRDSVLMKTSATSTVTVWNVGQMAVAVLVESVPASRVNPLKYIALMVSAEVMAVDLEMRVSVFSSVSKHVIKKTRSAFKTV